MRARVDRQKQTLYITEIRLLSGWLPEDGIGNEREKDKNNSPFEGVERKREECKFLWRVHK